MTTQTTPTLTVVPEAQPKRGFGTLPCPECNEQVMMSLDTDDCDLFRCDKCGEEMSVQRVIDWIEDREIENDRWRRLLDWVASAPLAD